jgi:hypothetical protein
MGSFCLFNFIMYMVFAIILSVHRDTFGVMVDGTASPQSGSGAGVQHSDYPEDDEQL